MLEAKNISKSFNNKLVLNNINLKINDGDTVLIIGPSGSGKTTLLRCFNYLNKPDKGEILLDGKKVSEENINYIREKIGIVFQSFNLFPHLTVLENLTLAPVKKKRLTKDEAIKKAKNLLKEYEILDKCDEYPDNLSGGQKQRVAISRALMMDPEIILFDEPTSALDPEMIEDVFESLNKLKESQVTLVIVSHEMSFIKKLNPRIVYIEDGTILKVGTYEECLKDIENKSLQLFLSKIS